MCGIIGYLGKNEASPILLESLRRLEYRGYDSAGITTIHNGKLFVKKAAGRLVNLADLLVKEPIRGKIGIGHTRWATHGKATTINAHPQSSNNVSVVHNGIIENYKEIKKNLIEEGYVFCSETDTEVIPLLCQKFLDQGFSYTDSVHQTVDLLKGQYAISFLFENNNDLIFLARSGSPLVIGHSRSTMYVASDALALAGLTKEITYLEDGDTAAVSREGTTIFDRSHQEVHRSKTFVSINAIDLQKGGFKHYMLKEIHEQPKALTKAIQTVTSENWLDEASVGNLPLDEIEGVNLLGCGTAEYACMIASYWFENLAKLPGRTEIASEFKYRDPIIKPNDLSIFVSQSGETADTLSALRYVIKNNGHNLSILNNLASTMAKEGTYS
ncbi:MAG: glutamine--fructose-6-phosphate transaminase (isomerizing), partial [Rhodobacteraceae bacterium]|nr:glutamine--fructose-6-phosphate transaminase (isomerizing) [Paracoccaceae bacterium]